MKKSMKLFLVALSVLVLFVFAGNFVNADRTGDFISDAAIWWKIGGDQGTIGGLDGGIMSNLARIVNVLGTTVIAIVAVVLGVKYMIGSASDKSDVKEQLITFLVACLFFFGWSNISSLIISGATYNSTTGGYEGISGDTQLFIFSAFTNATSIGGVAANIFAIVLFFAKIIAVIATMVIGVKYIFTGSEGKAKLKEKGPMFIIGILLIFSTLNVLTFISDAINATF